MQIRVNVNYFYQLWTQKHICFNSFWRCIFSFQIYVIYADFTWCSYLYTWLYKRISIWSLLTGPTCFYMWENSCEFQHDFVVSKISCPKPALYYFKFINIGLVEKLIFLNKLITTRYIAKPSHCEFFLVWQYLPVCLTYGVEAQQD